MSRYYLFSGMDYYPCMAMRDYKGSFASVAEAIAACVADDEWLQWAQIATTRNGDLVLIAYSYGGISDDDQFMLWADDDARFWDDAEKHPYDAPHWMGVTSVDRA